MPRGVDFKKGKKRPGREEKFSNGGGGGIQKGGGTRHPISSPIVKKPGAKEVGKKSPAAKSGTDWCKMSLPDRQGNLMEGGRSRKHTTPRGSKATITRLRENCPKKEPGGVIAMPLVQETLDI